MKQNIEIGSYLGSYKILEILGEGGMGLVYRAVHQESKEQVALKTVKVPHERMLRSIRREIGALAKIRHPGVVRILEHGLSPAGLPWYSMEFLQGKSLGKWRNHLLRKTHVMTSHPLASWPTKPWWTNSLAPDSSHVSSGSQEITTPLLRTKPSSSKNSSDTLVSAPPKKEPASPLKAKHMLKEGLQDVLDLMYSLCHALAYLHGEGILHRDLKPDNILVRAGNTPILMDFGLAKYWGSQSGREKLALDTGIAGTVSYMSPEQIQEETLDARSDLYSLGILFFELLVGDKPFSGETPIEVFHAHLYQKVPNISQWLSFLPKKLESLIQSLLAKKPQDRPGYAEDVARVLLQLGANAKQEVTLPKPKPYLYRPRFWGRERLQHSLKDWLKNANKKTKQLILLAGQSGAGKTRLLIEFAKQVSRKKFSLLIGECLDTPDPIALGVLQKPLRHIADRFIQKGKTDSTVEKWLKILANYEPSFAKLSLQSSAPKPEYLPPEFAMRRLYQALLETLCAYAQETHLLLLLDDLQWADELSLGFLQFLIREGNPLAKKISLVGAYRIEELNKNLEFLRENENVTHIVLEKLTESETAKMIGDMLSISPPPVHFSRFLSQHSEGNPFFISEYVKTAVKEGVLWRDQQSKWQVAELSGSSIEDVSYETLGLPQSIQTLVDRWLLSLSQESRHLLEAAALIGKEIPWNILERMVPTAYQSITELLHRQVLEETNPNYLRFSHDKLREGVLAGLAKTKRYDLHRKAAKAIEKELGIAGKEASLAHHWEQANFPEKAKQYYLLGAKQALKTYQHQEAERLYRTYLSLETNPCLTRLDALLVLGENVLHATAKDKQALEVFSQLGNEAKLLNQREKEVQSILLTGLTLLELGDLDKSEQMLQKSLSLVRSEKTRGQILLTMGNLKREQGDNQQTYTLYQEALSIAIKTNDRAKEGEILGVIGTLLKKQGKLEKAKKHYQKALEIAKETKSRRQEGIVTGNLATVFHAQFNLQETEKYYQQALEIAKEIGNRKGEGLLLGNLANLYREQGYIQKSNQHYQQALEIAKEIGNRKGECILLGNFANIYRDQGRWGQSETFYRQALKIAEKIQDSTSKAFCFTNLAFLYRDQNKQEKLIKTYEKALSLTKELHIPRLEGILLGLLIAVHQYESGKIKDAKNSFETALTITKKLKDSRSEAMIYRELAQMERRCQNDLATAKTLLSKSDKILREVFDKIQNTKILFYQGHLQLAQGKSAKDILQKARQATVELEAGPKSETGQLLKKLIRTQEAFTKKEKHRLFRGELWEDIPQKLRDWLTSNDMTPPNLSL